MENNDPTKSLNEGGVFEEKEVIIGYKPDLEIVVIPQVIRRETMAVIEVAVNLNRKDGATDVKEELTVEGSEKLNNCLLKLLKEGDVQGFNALKGKIKERFPDFTPRFPNLCLARADLSRADLSGLDLSLANLNRSILHGACFFGTHLNRASLISADLSEANMNEANLDKANLTWANLTGAMLRGADLSWARLCGAKMSGVKMVGANLTFANLACVDLSGVSLYEVNLAHADLSRADVSNACLKGSNIEGVNLTNVTGVTSEQLSEAKNLVKIKVNTRELRELVERAIDLSAEKAKKSIELLGDK